MKKTGMYINETLAWIIGASLLVGVLWWIVHAFGDKIIQFFRNLPDF